MYRSSLEIWVLLIISVQCLCITQASVDIAVLQTAKKNDNIESRPIQMLQKSTRLVCLQSSEESMKRLSVFTGSPLLYLQDLSMRLLLLLQSCRLCFPMLIVCLSCGRTQDTLIFRRMRDDTLRQNAYCEQASQCLTVTQQQLLHSDSCCFAARIRFIWRRRRS